MEGKEHVKGRCDCLEVKPRRGKSPQQYFLSPLPPSFPPSLI